MYTARLTDAQWTDGGDDYLTKGADFEAAH